MQSRPASSPTQRHTDSRPVWIGLALSLATCALFAGAITCDFVNYDDPDYVSANPIVQQGLTWAGTQWAFTSAAAFNWHPLTWLSHMLDCQLFGLKPAGHHATSVLLHALNTALLFLFLRSSTGAVWRSALVAAFFGFHPLRLESVIWVCERKDVLSTFFGLLALLAYHRYAITQRRLSSCLFYSLTSAFYILSLLSKPMLVTLPFLLLLMDYWPLRRLSSAAVNATQPRKSLGAAVLEKIPLFALTVASGLVTFLVQKSQGAVSSFSVIALHERLINALVSVLRYVSKTLWPANLSVYYPFPSSWPGWLVATAAVFLVAVSLLALRQLRPRPWLFVGWFWFLGTLVPVIGLIQVGTQSMADRYTYVPGIGLLILLIWGGTELIQRFSPHAETANGARPKRTTGPQPPASPPKWISLVTAGTLLALCAVSTFCQLPHWKNSRTLFEHALKHTTGNVVAEVMLGDALEKSGELETAATHYLNVLRLQPAFAEVRYNLANVLTQQRKLDEAITQYREVLRSKPDYPEAWYNLSVALDMQGNRAESFAALTQYARLRPDDRNVQEHLQRAQARQ